MFEGGMITRDASLSGGCTSDHDIVLFFLSDLKRDNVSADEEPQNTSACQPRVAPFNLYFDKTYNRPCKTLSPLDIMELN